MKKDTDQQSECNYYTMSIVDQYNYWKNYLTNLIEYYNYYLNLNNQKLDLVSLSYEIKRISEILSIFDNNPFSIKKLKELGNPNYNKYIYVSNKKPSVKNKQKKVKS